MRLFQPDDYLSAVTLIDPKGLVAQGVGFVLLDIDNTLVSRATHQLTEPVKEWVASLKANGLAVCLLSNNWHRTVFDYARQLEAPIVYKAMKPLPPAFYRARRKAWESINDPAQPVILHDFAAFREADSLRAYVQATGVGVAVVGDQLFTDVLGAHLLGWQAILVTPLSRTDLWYTQIFRKFEQLLMRGAQPRI